jgi:hypothetical protein
MKNKFIQILLLWGAVVFVGCPDDVVVDPDPCAGLTSPFKANFKIQELIGDSVLVLSDKIYAYANIQFVASMECDSVNWQIGIDPRTFRTRTVDLRFSNSIGDTIPIRLIAWRKLKCDPTDDGIDTVEKKVYVVGPENTPLNGSYFGYHDDNPADTQTVTIRWDCWVDKDSPKNTFCTFGILNYLDCNQPNPLTGIPDFDYPYGGVRGLVFRNDGHSYPKCGPFYERPGYIILDPTLNRISIRVSTYDSTANGKKFYTHRKFTGVRL